MTQEDKPKYFRFTKFVTGFHGAIIFGYWLLGGWVGALIATALLTLASFCGGHFYGFKKELTEWRARPRPEPEVIQPEMGPYRSRAVFKGPYR